MILMRIDMSWDGSNLTTRQKRRYETELSLFERNIVKYTRLHQLPEKKSNVITFGKALDGAAYKDPKDGSIRVKVGEIYLRFTEKGVVEGYLPDYWPPNTLSCDEVHVDLGLFQRGV
jgi:hypothetical protein